MHGLYFKCFLYFVNNRNINVLFTFYTLETPVNQSNKTYQWVFFLIRTKGYPPVLQFTWNFIYAKLNYAILYFFSNIFPFICTNRLDLGNFYSRKSNPSGTDIRVNWETDVVVTNNKNDLQITTLHESVICVPHFLLDGEVIKCLKIFRYPILRIIFILHGFSTSCYHHD